MDHSISSPGRLNENSRVKVVLVWFHCISPPEHKVLCTQSVLELSPNHLLTQWRKLINSLPALLCLWFLAPSLLDASRPRVESSFGMSQSEQARQEVLAGEGSVDFPLWTVLHQLSLPSSEFCLLAGPQSAANPQSAIPHNYKPTLGKTTAFKWKCGSLSHLCTC